jgi:hypothetical protein
MAAGLVATSVVSGQAPNWSQKAGWSSLLAEDGVKLAASATLSN